MNLFPQRNFWYDRIWESPDVSKCPENKLFSFSNVWLSKTEFPFPNTGPLSQDKTRHSYCCWFIHLICRLFNFYSSTFSRVPWHGADWLQGVCHMLHCKTQTYRHVSTGIQNCYASDLALRDRTRLTPPIFISFVIRNHFAHMLEYHLYDRFTSLLGCFEL
jgi:hypothetical protein